MPQRRALEDAVPGEELPAIEFVVTPQRVQFYAEGVEDFHPWYMYKMEGSPFKGPIAHPTMCHVFKVLFWKKYFPARLTGGRMHVKFDAEYFDPAKVGERLTIKGRVLDKYLKRGRHYLDTEFNITGEDGRSIARYRDTTLLSYKKEE